ncbi:Acyl carrier protein [Hahella chejuensis KCTC 2396]|uniref:Acyl carrier protein n=1 Tax=Hahella chejuensis (strain KCTC 2396) TaxID=349521 RepID=Q2S9J4_HAHCH|nr:acyl carrier protein [Hahella chejuensis]ABB69079.1 putative peptidyl carrier protein [Hahella chejuensis KCTC 2396]ABC32680.1 Acyl carrier protein [Hahella chejuensis KCTC 2396]
MLENTLLTYISENYLGSDDEGFNADTPILELNIIDSGSLFDLVDLLRRETGASIPLNQVTPGNFASVRKMVDLVTRLQQH